MNPRYVLAAALSMSLLAGCQSAREAYMVDAFNAQDLILEDKIYELSNRLDELEARLELRGNRLQRSADEAGSDETDNSSAPSSGSMAPDEEEDTDLTPPEVEPGTPADPEGVPSPDGDDADIENTSTARQTSFEESPNDRDVMELSINEVRPANFDRQPGDDGILVVLEPKNADGETVLDPAMIEIKIGDPTDRCHYGPWEFPPDAVANCVQNTDKVQAIVLQVPWDKIPQHNKLDLFVQYTRPDGERLQNRTRFNTNLHESVASRWSARGASTAPRQLPQVVPAPMIDDQEDGPPVDVYQ
jgi:outer membrane murein-binding lipoprotein Lpp